MADPTKIILDYVQQQNRPLNVQNVADALQKHSIKKPTVQRALDAAAESGTVSFKDYGKQRIFMARQDCLAVLSTEEMEGVTAGNGAKQGEVMRLRETCGGLEKELQCWQSSLTDEQIAEKVERLQRENMAMATKLAALKQGSHRVSSSDRKDTEAALQRFLALWRSRRRMFNSFFSAVTENMTRNLTEFKEELGIETDEDVGVQPSDFDSFGINPGDNGSNKAVGKLNVKAMVTPERCTAAARSAIVPIRGTPVPRTPQPLQTNAARIGDDEETRSKPMEVADVAKTSTSNTKGASKGKSSKEKRPRNIDEGIDKGKAKWKKMVEDDE